MRPSTRLLVAALLVVTGLAVPPTARASVVPSTGDLVAGAGWTLTEPMSSARSSTTATRLPDGRVLVAGGLGPNGSTLRSAELFDPTTGRFGPTGSLVADHGALSSQAILLTTGKVLVLGGWQTSGVVATAAELYDPATGRFTATGSLRVPRHRAKLVELADGRVLVAGGSTGGFGTTATAELYDPAAGTFTLTGSMADARSNLSLTRLPSGKVLAAGGFYGVDTAELYDPATGRWSRAGSLGTLREEIPSGVVLPDGTVLIAGGSGRSAETYDPATGRFSPTGSMSTDRYSDFTQLVLPSGLVLVAGGDAPGYVATRSADLYDPATRSFRATAPLSVARYWHGWTMLDDGRVLVVGGSTAASGDGRPTATAEVYATTTTGGPPGAPTGVSGRLVGRSALLTFAPPASDGGSPVTAYLARCAAVGHPTRTGTATSSPAEVPGLLPGVAYGCTVSATNLAGTGPASAPVRLAVPRRPGPPRSVTLTVAEGRLLVDFAAPLSDGGSPIVSYLAVCTSPDGGFTVAGRGPSSPILLGRPPAAVHYSCIVFATSAVGTGRASAPSPAVLTPAG